MWIPRRSVQSIASWSSPTLALLGRISGWGIKTEACPVSAAGRRTRRSQVRPVLAERYSPKTLLPCLLDEMNKRTIIFLFWGSTWHVIDRKICSSLLHPPLVPLRPPSLAVAREPADPHQTIREGAVCRPRCGSRKHLRNVHMQLVSQSLRRENTRRSEFLSRREDIVSGRTQGRVRWLPHVLGCATGFPLVFVFSI